MVLIILFIDLILVACLKFDLFQTKFKPNQVSAKLGGILSLELVLKAEAFGY